MTRHTPTPHRTAALLVTLIALSMSAPLSAQEASEEGAPTEPLGYLGLELGIGQIDEDIFFATTATAAFEFEVGKVACRGWFPELGSDPPDDCASPLRLAAQLPMRLRIGDRDPQDDALIRAEDWDEAAEFMRVVRLAEYGVPEDPLYARAGELSGVILGHGTIMNRYYNVIDVDHYQLGINSNVNSRYGGAQLMLDNVADPTIFGGRVYVQPVELASPGSWWSRYTVGATMVLDIHAPLTFERVDASVDLNQPNRVDDQNNLIARTSSVTGVVGIDNALELVKTELVDFTPYLDLNAHLDGDPGLHLGALVDIRASEDFRLKPRMEVRWLGRQYLPEYFGSLYEVERDAFFAWNGAERPKLKVLRDELDTGVAYGGAGELTMVLWQRAELTLGYADHEGPNNTSALARLRVRRVGPANLGLYYRQVGFNGMDDLLEFDNALLVTEVRYPVVDWLYLLGQYGRQWRLQQSGRYETVHDWQIGAGSAVTF